MTINENEGLALAVLDQLLELTDESDWPLVHMTVRDDVRAGKYGQDFERAYKALVDKKMAER